MLNSSSSTICPSGWSSIGDLVYPALREESCNVSVTLTNVLVVIGMFLDVVVFIAATLKVFRKFSVDFATLICSIFISILLLGSGFIRLSDGHNNSIVGLNTKLSVALSLASAFFLLGISLVLLKFRRYVQLKAKSGIMKPSGGFNITYLFSGLVLVFIGLQTSVMLVCFGGPDRVRLFGKIFLTFGAFESLSFGWLFYPQMAKYLEADLKTSLRITASSTQLNTVNASGASATESAHNKKVSKLHKRLRALRVVMIIAGPTLSATLLAGAWYVGFEPVLPYVFTTLIHVSFPIVVFWMVLSIEKVGKQGKVGSVASGTTKQ